MPLFSFLTTPCGCESKSTNNDFNEKVYDRYGNEYSKSDGDGNLYDESHHVIGKCIDNEYYDNRGNRMY